MPWDKKLRETNRVMTVARAQVGVSDKDLPSPFSSTMVAINPQKQHAVSWKCLGKNIKTPIASWMKNIGFGHKCGWWWICVVTKCWDRVIRELFNGTCMCCCCCCYREQVSSIISWFSQLLVLANRSFSSWICRMAGHLFYFFIHIDKRVRYIFGLIN